MLSLSKNKHLKLWFEQLVPLNIYSFFSIQMHETITLFSKVHTWFVEFVWEFFLLKRHCWKSRVFILLWSRGEGQHVEDNSYCLPCNFCHWTFKKMMSDCFRDVGITHLIDTINFLINYGFSWIQYNGFVDYGPHEAYILPCPILMPNVQQWMLNVEGRSKDYLSKMLWNKNNLWLNRLWSSFT